VGSVTCLAPSDCQRDREKFENKLKKKKLVWELQSK